MQEGSNLDTVGNCTFFFPVKQQGQTVYTNIGRLLLAALHKMQLAGWQSGTAPRGTAGD